jgi:hypothetical protein
MFEFFRLPGDDGKRKSSILPLAGPEYIFAIVVVLFANAGTLSNGIPPPLGWP